MRSMLRYRMLLDVVSLPESGVDGLRCRSDAPVQSSQTIVSEVARQLQLQAAFVYAACHSTCLVGGPIHAPAVLRAAPHPTSFATLPHRYLARQTCQCTSLRTGMSCQTTAGCRSHPICEAISYARLLLLHRCCQLCAATSGLCGSATQLCHAFGWAWTQTLTEAALDCHVASAMAK